VQDFTVENAKKFLEKYNTESKKKDPNAPHITFTHLIVKAVAWGCHKQRRDIGRIVFGFFKPTKSIGYTVLCDQGGGKDLVPITIWDAHSKSLEEISIFLTARVAKAKSNTDVEFTKATAPFAKIPTFIMQPVMHIMGYFAANIGVEFPGSNLKPE
jgi:pyruvate/2-oxoglutarate dehydrogenase complex dihydrolipoamide acyltransferase (E2) component